MLKTFRKDKPLQKAPIKGGGSTQVWWRLMRPHTLTASFIPVLIGTSLALSKAGHIDLSLFIAMLTACVLVQGATNVFNEYYDFKRRLDLTELEERPGILKITDPEQLEWCLRQYYRNDEQAAYEIFFVRNNGDVISGFLGKAGAPAFIQEHFAG
jgi:hypothetical protein